MPPGCRGAHPRRLCPDRPTSRTDGPPVPYERAPASRAVVRRLRAGSDDVMAARHPPVTHAVVRRGTVGACPGADSFDVMVPAQPVGFAGLKARATGGATLAGLKAALREARHSAGLKARATRGATVAGLKGRATRVAIPSRRDARRSPP